MWLHQLQSDDITDINRIQEYEVNAGVTLDEAGPEEEEEGGGGGGGEAQSVECATSLRKVVDSIPALIPTGNKIFV